MEDLYLAGVKVNSVKLGFLKEENTQGNPITKKQRSTRLKLKIFIFSPLVKEVFFNNNPTK